jgi:Domain of unknown function (DUF4345)
MSNIATFLKIAGSIPIMVGVLHLFLGLKADVLLGAKLPDSVIADPALDSQNRFYGVAFMLYGFCLFVGGSDLKRYLPIVRWTIWIFFAAGMSRLLSILFYGFPPPLVMTLLLIEVVGTPILLMWLARSSVDDLRQPVQTS